MKRSSLYVVTFMSIVLFFAILLGLVFYTAGTMTYWNGWGFLLSFLLPTLLITAYFLRKDPSLIERRIKPAETRPQQVLGQSLAGLIFLFGLIGVSVLDYRFSWSKVISFLSVIADVLILFGFLIVFLVFNVNTYTSKAIEVTKNQKVVTSGLYAIVRHPMYSGALLIIISIPISLGSLYGLISSALLVGIIVFRLLDEEKLLKAKLDGYTEYCRKTKYRLVPFVW